MANYEFRKLLNFLGYIATILIAVAILLSYIFKGNGSILGGSGVTGALLLIANIIAYFITALSGFYYARSKRNIWFLISWIVAIVLIVVFVILNCL